MMRHHFEPDAVRARQLDHSMLVRLGESLRHLSEQCRSVVPHDVARLETLASALERGERQSPAVFAHYYRLLDAVLDEQFDEAERQFVALVRMEPVASALKIKPLAPHELGANYNLYLNMMNADPSIDLGFAPPLPSTFATFKQRLEAGLNLLRKAVPELAGEIEAIIHEIVIVAGDKSKAFQFDGGSHFQLWGALFLNGDFHPDEVGIVEVLAHESAHSLLFGFCTDQLLVNNEDEELYSSPLRPDPRPMDGIYHATFVSARMHWAMAQLLESNLLNTAARERAMKANVSNIANFRSGYSVVKEHGRLTELGQRLMQGASSYVSGVIA
jgi:HEXXH motif-containing protein